MQSGYNSSRCAAGLLKGRRKKKKKKTLGGGGNFTFLNISVIVWLSGVVHREVGGNPTRGILRSSFIFGHLKKKKIKKFHLFFFYIFILFSCMELHAVSSYFFLVVSCCRIRTDLIWNRRGPPSSI